MDHQAPKDLAVHLIADNYATHEHAEVQRWLADHPRFHTHLTPTGSSRLNMVKRFFRDISGDRIRCDRFGSARESVRAILACIVEHSRHPKPFTSTVRADDISAKVARGRAALAKLGTYIRM